MSDYRDDNLKEALNTIEDLEAQIVALKRALTCRVGSEKLITIELDKNIDGDYEVIKKILY